jgi:Glycosyl transferase family 2.
MQFLKYNPKYVVNMDSDGQHSVDDLDNVLEPLVTGRAQAVIGVRPLKDMPLSRNIANAIMNLLTRIFYKVDVSDSQTGFRAITIDALKKININARGYLISSEFIREVNDNNIHLLKCLSKQFTLLKLKQREQISKKRLKYCFR